MAQLAVAWVLQNDNVASAIVGASRPEQVAENVKAAGVRIPAELMARIDEALGDLVERDPAQDRGRTPRRPARLTAARTGGVSCGGGAPALDRGGGSRNRRICMLRIRA